MESLILFAGFPIAVGVFLAKLEAEKPLRTFWASALGLSLCAAVIFAIWMSPFRESSPVTAAMWGICPTLLSAIAIRLLHRWRAAWQWKALIASVVASVSIMPVFMASCIVADVIVPRHGCFF